MSNYPPGVSGNELEIAGPDWEGEVTRTCSQTDVTLHLVTKYAIGNIRLWHTIHKDEPMTAQDILGLCEEITVAECPCIDVEVDAWSYGGTLHWTCPACEHEYEEDERDE